MKFSHSIIRFICSVCGKAFRAKLDLKHHNYSHTGEKPLKCSYPDCGKTFRYNESKRDHERVHTGETYKCDQEGCNQEFAMRNQWKRHSLKVHGV